MTKPQNAAAAASNATNKKTLLRSKGKKTQTVLQNNFHTTYVCMSEFMDGCTNVWTKQNLCNPPPSDPIHK